MIILKMRASFGKLNDELTLHEGLNLLCMPNEAGKSTWSAFLLAMLYGIDTKEKASSLNNHLPVKERYKPWDGRPMQGMMEVLWNGRRITIERHSQGKIPMGAFKAYDTDSGAPISELNADNCGRMLCGVERSVFERTAFIRQLGLPVSEDHALEKRLNTLVTTGEEGKSASQIAEALHKMKLKINARLSRSKAQIDLNTQQQNALRDLQTDAMSLQAQVDHAQSELARLSELSERIEQAEKAKKHMALAQMEQKLQLQEAQYADLQAQSAALPSPEELQKLRAQFDEASSRLQTAQLEHAFSPEAPKKPQPPSCFIGMDAAQARQKQNADAAQYARLSASKPAKKFPVFLCILGLITGLALIAVQLWLGIALAAANAVLTAVSLSFYLRNSANYQKNLRQADLILGRYGVGSMEQTELLLAEYEAQMCSYEQALAAYEAGANARREHLQSVQNELEEIIKRVQAFAPDCTDASRARQAISAALQIHAELSSQRRSIELQRSQLVSMKQLLGDQTAQAVDTEALRMDAAKIAYEKNAAAQQLSRLQQKLAEQNGKISAGGDLAELHSQAEQYQKELADAEQAAAIITLAENALSRADETLRSRFSPQITAEAGKILAKLTAQKYPNVLLKPDMTLSVREDSGTVTHPAAAMSCGTSDQMYLALRLAMVRRLLENAPILLDDALVNFDDTRTAAAISLLTEEAKERQIILFTCKEIP